MATHSETLNALPEITSFHAHVYFDADTLPKARALCERAAELFALQMGRVHERPVGPHPDWSCQLAFEMASAGEVIAWLALNRDGLVVFVHPETGQPLQDHRDHGIWMGAVRPLDLSVFGAV
jgi:aromatic ring-cleaving dioxygenase